MKFTVTFNVLGKSGRPTTARVSVDVHNVGRSAAIAAAADYIVSLGVPIPDQPCSVRSSGSQRRAAARAVKSAPRRGPTLDP